MRKRILILVAVGLLAILSSLPASAQTAVVLVNSSENVTFQGNGSGGLNVTLGSCGLLGCTLSGSASGSGNASGTTGYSITSSGPISFASSGSGNFLANAAAVVNIVLTTSTGTLAGTITNLTFGQASSSTNGMVSMSGQLNLAGGIVGSISGTVNIGAGANINAVASGTTSVSGQVAQVTPIPEPTSAFLLGSGLVALGGVLRRRKAPRG